MSHIKIPLHWHYANDETGPRLQVTFYNAEHADIAPKDREKYERDRRFIQQILPTTAKRQDTSTGFTIHFSGLEAVATAVDMLYSHAQLLRQDANADERLERAWLALAPDYLDFIRQQPLPQTYAPKSEFKALGEAPPSEPSLHVVAKTRRYNRNDPNEYFRKHLYIGDRQQFESACGILANVLTQGHSALVLSLYQNGRARGNASRAIPGFETFQRRVLKTVNEFRERLLEQQDSPETQRRMMERQGIPAKEIQPIIELLKRNPENKAAIHDALLDTYCFAINGRDYIERGLPETMMMRLLCQDEDGHSNNVGIDGEDTCANIDTDRFFWPLLGQNFGYEPEDDYIFDRKQSGVPLAESMMISAENIVNLTSPFLEHQEGIKPRNMLNSPNEHVFINVANLDEEDEFKRRKYAVLLKFLLLDRQFFIEIAQRFISQPQWQRAFVDYLTAHQQNVARVSLPIDEFRQFAFENPELYQRVKREMTAFNTTKSPLVPPLNLEQLDRRFAALRNRCPQQLGTVKPIKIRLHQPQLQETEDRSALDDCLRIKRYIETHQWHVRFQRRHRQAIIHTPDGKAKRVPYHVYFQYRRLCHALTSLQDDFRRVRNDIVTVATTACRKRGFSRLFRHNSTQTFYNDMKAMRFSAANDVSLGRAAAQILCFR